MAYKLQAMCHLTRTHQEKWLNYNLCVNHEVASKVPSGELRVKSKDKFVSPSFSCHLKDPIVPPFNPTRQCERDLRERERVNRREMREALKEIPLGFISSQYYIQKKEERKQRRLM